LFCSLSIEAASIHDVNEAVAEIEKNIQLGQYDILKIDSSPHSEGRAPSYQYYHKKGELFAVYISVGHETWVTTHQFYFRHDKSLMKYIKLIVGRPDNPKKRAVIYNDNESVLWSNIEQTNISKENIVNIFRAYQNNIDGLSLY